MTIIITQERPDTPDAMQLIDELEATLSPLYPDESRHGYSVDKLIRQGVNFFVVRQDGKPIGCGGVQFYGTDYGELKRMYIHPDYRGQGLSKQLLAHLADYSQKEGITLLRLETGIHQTAALGLYENVGFYRIEAFGDYQPDPLAVFMEKQLI
ncbi:MAG: GNAT family N-acetyltransferase [Phototrophicaceae bacterium]